MVKFLSHNYNELLNKIKNMNEIVIWDALDNLSVKANSKSVEKLSLWLKISLNT